MMSTSTRGKIDRLIASTLQDSLGGSLIGCRVLVLESTGSTNDFLRRMITPELPEGTVVFAEEQTAGRGQHGHSWESAPRLGLWFSFLLRPALPLAQSSRLTAWAAQAVATTVRNETGLPAVVKPPNDVYIAERKVAGALVEAQTIVGGRLSAIVGIGVNLNQTSENFSPELRDRAGSLALLLGHRIERANFAIALLRELERTRAASLVSPHPSSSPLSP